MSMVLYHYWRSSASWRVRWALEIKKVPHKKIHIDLLSAAEKEQEYLKKNPSAYVPCLEVDGRYLAESVAILEWLEEAYPSNALLPGDSFQRAKIRQFAETINAGIQPLHNLDVLKQLSDDSEKQKQWAQKWISRGLGVCEELLKELPENDFIFGTNPTLADLCLIPQCYSAIRFGVDLNEYFRCKKIYEHALSTEECASSLPEKFKP